MHSSLLLRSINSTLSTYNNTTSTYANFNITTTNIPNYQEDNTVLKIFILCMCILILMIGVIGNILVLIVFGSRWSVLKTYEVYMVSLAVADLLATITYPGKLIHQLIGGSFHYIGVPGCTAIEFVGTSSVAVSSFTLLVIAFDRYIVVKWPLRERCNNLTLACIVIGTWLAGMTLSGSLFFVDGRMMLHEAVKGIKICYLNLTRAAFKVNVIALFIVQSGLPLTLMSVIYCLAIYELHKPAAVHTLGQGDRRYSRYRSQRSKKVTQLLILVVVVFFICITPEKVFYLLYIFDVISVVAMETPGSIVSIIYTILVMLFMMNSCVNPIIYAKLHTAFRRCTLRLVCSCCSHKSLDWERVRSSFRSAVTSYASASRPLSRSSMQSFRERNLSSSSIIKYFISTNSRRGTISDGGFGDLKQVRRFHALTYTFEREPEVLLSNKVRSATVQQTEEDSLASLRLSVLVKNETVVGNKEFVTSSLVKEDGK